MIPYNEALTENSKNLRKNMTPEEKHIWYDFLKNLPCQVKRQKCICNYIVDFYIPSKKTVIEIDGSQHYEADNLKKDKIRDSELMDLGISVLRYTNDDVNSKFNSVCFDILTKLELIFEDLNN
ncbi:MAG: endonuclease domain-containing protein [Clostridia bacterium]|nr:endonuclease domain-containing protein [Clostridia bacterium]